ncbi:DEAD/DEAH box helicase [Lolliginicoccus suaedae]|uniref:DEAD/DEAH box helicase n=1 Tax=Lolliginicoccus suaedae TaxID=2605429 RepID=UPI0011ED3E0E|nr:DEAD/DEAH box helicase [Lolliginicoccus suaedae]
MSTTTFTDLGVPANICKVLANEGKTEAFPIQIDTLTDSLGGRDILGRGRTGSGKTLAFAIPLVARIADAPQIRPSMPRGLVLAPTRELATQIAAVITPLAAASGMRVTTVFGGVPQSKQVNALKRGAHIVVACPGRLEDLMKQRVISLDEVKVTVLDEADHMADLGFLPGVRRILSATPRNGQRLFFSATLDNGIDSLAKQFLNSPMMHSVDEEHSPVAAMTHHIFEVDNAGSKRDLISELASGTGRRILFMRTKHHAKRLARQLSENGIPAVDLHGNLSQAQRDRNLAAFGKGNVRVLVATDVAARGVHVDDVELVVHVDPPVEHKAYLHRSGRTARAGKQGDVVTIVLPEQRSDLRKLLRKAEITAKPIRVTPGDASVNALVGDKAAIVPMVIRAEPERAPRQAHGRPSHGPARQGGSGRGGSSRGGAGRGRSASPGFSHGGERHRGGSGHRSTVSAAPRRDSR